MFIVALLTTKLWKQPRCTNTDEWIKKISIYIQWNKYLIEIHEYYEKQVTLREVTYKRGRFKEGS
jgi:hypothetical protein